MSKSLVVCLHGFLGRGQDWRDLTESVRGECLERDFEFWCPDLLAPDSLLSPELSFKQWVVKFFAELGEFSYDNCYILSYSMGGRLALHALMENPLAFAGAIFLSTNPGLVNQEEKDRRKKNDDIWSKKFVSEPWEQCLQEWNQQPLFSQEDTHPVREEQHYSRRFLGLALQHWSIVEHQVKLDDLVHLAIPNLWIAGEFDNKFVAIMNMMKQRAPRSDYRIMTGKAHRLGFDADPALVAEISKFLTRN